MHAGDVSPVQSADQNFVTQADATGITTQDAVLEKCLAESIAVATTYAAVVAASAGLAAANALLVSAQAAYALVIAECALPDPTDALCPLKLAAAQTALIAAASEVTVKQGTLAAATGAASYASARLVACLASDDDGDGQDWPGEEEPGDGGGGGGGGDDGGGECPDEQEVWCDVDYTYEIETGDIVDFRILRCYCA